MILHPKDKRKTHGTEEAQGEDTGSARELTRRGLEDGIERLRGQLRDTAQGGQADHYGDDQIEDAAAGGVRHAEHRAERLLGKGKRKRVGPSAGTPSNEPSAPAENTPASSSVEQRPQIRTRESAKPPSAAPAQEPSKQTVAKPAVKTKGAYLQRESAPSTEPPSQGGRAAGREQGRIAARDLAQRRGWPEVKSAPQSDGRVASSHKAGGKAGRNSCASPRPASASGAPASRTPQGHTVPGKGLPSSKRAPRLPRGAVKTAEHTSRRTIKTATRRAKTAERTARAAPRTMQAAANLTRHTAQAVRATVQTAAVTAKAAARSAVAGGQGPPSPPLRHCSPPLRRAAGLSSRSWLWCVWSES